MNTISVSQILLLAFWFLFAFLVYILALIARFYEASSGQATYYRYYAVPIVAQGLATARYLVVHRWARDTVGDLLSLVGGLVLMVLCVHLYRQMTNRRR